LKFEELNNTIPYAKGGKEKVLRYSPYPNITLAMPGRHAKDTIPVGGDFVVMVTDSIYPVTDHQFTHTDIFKDVEAKCSTDQELTCEFMYDYMRVIQGKEVTEYWNDIPNPIAGLQDFIWEGTMHPATFLHAAQCLAVAEHRRYAKYEDQFGGRYLPFRFAAGIAEELWTAADAANLQKRGRPGVEILENAHGVPEMTKELMK
jgi:hypothetical protein